MKITPIVGNKLRYISSVSSVQLLYQEISVVNKIADIPSTLMLSTLAKSFQFKGMITGYSLIFLKRKSTTLY